MMNQNIINNFKLLVSLTKMVKNQYKPNKDYFGRLSLIHNFRGEIYEI
jgi:hypothetical protein